MAKFRKYQNWFENRFNQKSWVLILVVPFSMFLLVSCTELLTALWGAIEADHQFPIHDCVEIEPKSKTFAVTITVLDKDGNPLPNIRMIAEENHRDMRPVEIDGVTKCGRFRDFKAEFDKLTNAAGKVTFQSGSHILDRRKEAIEFKVKAYKNGSRLIGVDYFKSEYDDPIVASAMMNVYDPDVL